MENGSERSKVSPRKATGESDVGVKLFTLLPAPATLAVVTGDAESGDTDLIHNRADGHRASGG